MLDRAGRAARSAVAVLLLAVAVSPLDQAPSAAAEEARPRTVRLKDFDNRGPWRLESLEIDGLPWWQAWTLSSSLQTQERPIWKFWADDPPFSGSYLHADLATIRSNLEGEGYYEARVDERIEILSRPKKSEKPDGEPTPGTVAVRIRVRRGEPVLVCSLYIDLESVTISSAASGEIRKRFPLAVGEPFRRTDYQEAASRYADYLADHGYPEARVQRHARVEVRDRCAEVAFGLEAGGYGVFGSTKIKGLKDVEKDVVQREIAYAPGEQFDQRKLDETRTRLQATRLFSVVRIEKKERTAEGAVPIELELSEGPQNEIRLGIGYGTFDGVRGLASWWNYDFLGDNRRLGFSGKISQINRALEASLIQPHFPRLRDRGSLVFTLGQQDECPYVDFGFVMTPKIDWWINEHLTATTYFSFRYDTLSNVTEQTVLALGPPDQFQVAGFTNGIGAGIRWTGFDDPANPIRGIGVAAAAEVAGGPLGGDFDHFRLIGQAAYYQPLDWQELVLFLGLRAGTIVPWDDTPQVPLWARLYAGGNAAFPVRGYGRRRVGPLSASNDPLGGRTAVVGTAELLYPLFGPVVGLAFLDAGDVELEAWTVRPENVQKGVGVGVRAVTPVGPIEVDFGFGLDRAPGDSIFQVQLTIGPQF